MSKVVVIGAGASGIIAALTASVKNDVILIDGNDKCGKKILVTGNGKCNYWNENINVKNYYSSEENLLNRILKNKDEVLNYLYSIGIYPKVKNGYYYPASNTSASIREIFDKELNRCNVKTIYNTRVLNIEKDTDKYIIITNDEKIICDKVIIATGSKAAPKTGSDGWAFNILKKFNHKINMVLPSLVALNTEENIKEWAGVRVDAKLSLIINNKLLKEEIGELQLTENGISGICTFNLSSLVSKGLYKNDEVLIKINFMPIIDNFYEFFNKRNNEINNRNIGELLESIINYKLLNVILKRSKINKDEYWQNLTDLDKENLINNITKFELVINNTNSFEKAQVCTGGIPLEETNETMESIYHNNMFIVGELLDVDGLCGGFNLAFAFITGYIAGKNV